MAEIVDDFFFVAILEDTEEIHELEDVVITIIPVIAGEEGVQFLVYLVGYDVEARLVIISLVHQGGPTVGAVLTYLYHIKERGLYEGVEEVNQEIVVAVEEDVGEGEVAMTYSNWNLERAGEGLELFLGT